MKKTSESAKGSLSQGGGRRVLGFGLFFIVSGIGALGVWWLAIHGPVALTKIFRHFDGIDEAAASISIGFQSLAVVCIAMGSVLLVSVAIGKLARKIQRPKR